ncbi:MAG: CinA family nicotinamide mononucleotide deamidase-related protein [Candidatus Eisenbacteria bacterium]|uniref:CinA-like protein n=1 Tax=Eiseniibacteriota bacterium TaxID=2212470 RepID=A0A948RRR4_UNCEI|nr:CinA family nicotinamide mononucleotide deamidase-related protein [Candidatus Eisenbacteria bacterium]MBU1950646.1 CinA family nicotinamide mononucleotide deamidase-related protein [Candidatus Eisenbacteria bacterium]MBU2689655.1 CinA family nicotinamide mononucleotide deamidase-related protein [Candidatus Eisenbacteria bacterium]
MNACLISIGSELLDGSHANTNALFLTRFLAREGFTILRVISVGDDPEEIRDTLDEWLGRTELVVLTGGLGATPDDQTRSGVARACRRRLALHEASAENIRRRLRHRSGPGGLPEESSALLPLGAEALENPKGLAPGFALEERGTLVVALPGVPSEMEAIWGLHATRLLERWSGERLRRWRTLHTCGLPETEVVNRVFPVLSPEVEVGYLCQPGLVDIVLGLSGVEPELSRNLAAVTARVAEVMGDAAYGQDGDTLEGVVGKLLSSSSRTLGVAESLTGGTLGSWITREPGSSRYFLGSIVAYSNRAKEDLLGVDPGLLREHGAVSPQVACAMAQGVRRKLGSDVAVSTTGIAGPSGATPAKPVGLVYVGCAEGPHCRAFPFQFRSHRVGNIERSVVAALNVLRLVLMRGLVEEEPGRSRDGR